MVNTVQNVLGGSASIISLNPPPEGTAGCQVTFTVDPTIGFVAQSFQMSNAQGLSISQVVSLVIDNTANPCSITVQHGVMNEKTVVAALGLQIVPTFSNKGPFPITITLSPGLNALPSAPVAVAVSFLNYNRPSASVGGSNGLAANAPAALAGVPFTTGIQVFTSINSASGLISGGETYYLYNLDLTIGSVTAIAAGAVIVVLQLFSTSGWNMDWPVVTVASSPGQIIPLNIWRNWQFNPTPIFAHGPTSDINVQTILMNNASAINWCANVVFNQIGNDL